MRRVVMGGLVLPLTLLLGSCGGGDTPSAEPAGGSAPSSETPTSATPSESDQPSESPSETEAPADTFADYSPVTGTRITGTAYSIATPAEWDAEPTTTSLGGNAVGPDFTTTVELADGNAVSSRSLDEQVEAAKQFASFGPDGQRLPDVTLDGNTAYHYAGIDTDFDNFVDEFGFQTGGREISIRVSTPKNMAQAEREEFVGTVMASLQPTTGG